MLHYNLLPGAQLDLVWQAVLLAPAQKRLDFLKKLVEKQILTARLIAIELHQKNDYEGLNLVGILAATQQFEFLADLWFQRLFGAELFERQSTQGNFIHINPFEILVFMSQNHECNNLLSALFTLNIVTEKMLLAAQINKKNSLWHLIDKNQFDLVEILFENKVITRRLLEETA